MPRQVSCKIAKKINSTIRKKITGALKDLKNKQPLSAATKLYQAGEIITRTTNRIWDKPSTLSLGNETSWVSFQLMDRAKMRKPIWKERTEAMLQKLDRIERKTSATCR